MNNRQTSLERFAIAPRSRTLILGQTGSGEVDAGRSIAQGLGSQE
jgi:hypothetical protein